MNFRLALFISLCIATIITEILGIPGSSGAGRSGKLTTQKSAVTTSKSNSKQAVPPNAQASKVSRASSGSLLSAWGIIFLILFVSGGSAVIYYVSVFYPIVCAKRGKYDVMEMTTV